MTNPNANSTCSFRFSNDIKFMLGKEPNWYWKAMWLFITPGLIAWITLHFLYITLVNGIEYNAWDHEKVSAFE